MPDEKGPSQAAEDKAAAVRAHLDMAHLKEGKDAALAAASSGTPRQVDLDDPRMKERYGFRIDWPDGHGKRWQGRFVTKILNIRERKAVGAMRAKQVGHAPVESLAVDAFLLVYWTCWMELSLVERPEWFEDIDSLVEPDLVEAVFKEVSAHDRTFHGYDEPREAGGPAG